ncbi:MAG: c-type cytochrome [Holophagales bacterium]|nr:c-type cytochrome [Holophagales bacterium]MYG29027.1 c-type cytochrome [Holophagales bacterium]MYI80653.1 c-type cytochrome [Holophagales bacterium]
MTAHARRRTQAAATLAAAALLVALPTSGQVDLGTEEQRAGGKIVYDKYCGQCHGDTGDGNGYATPRVQPKPRDFTTGTYKFRTTPNGTLPTDDDLRRIIEIGAPYTSMPGWPNLTSAEVQNVIYYIKSFSSAFENPDRYAEPIDIPRPLESTEESIARGRVVYEEQGCAACHGEVGRGDGPSAPTLVNDKGDPIKVADLTQRWTYRGGPTKEDIYRTFSTGLNGTPMPSYADSLEVEDRQHLVNYVHSLGDADDPNYGTLITAVYSEEPIDLQDGETLDALFESAPMTRFPLVGQITEPGRNFFPSVTSIEAQAIYNRDEIAFRVRWHDLRADTSGRNNPSLEVPMWDEDNGIGGDAADDSGDSDDFFGDFGGEEAPPEDDFFGDSGDDFFGDGGDDFFGTADAGAGGAEFSDAVALQFPASLAPEETPELKPYFLYGDAQNPVDLWFVNLTYGVADTFRSRGSDSIEATEADIVEAVTSYDQGAWTVTYKRRRSSRAGVSFAEEQYTPVAFSVWDGFNRERGNKRALSSWFYVYTEPSVEQAVAGPVLRAALIVLVVELLVVFLVRRRARQQAADEETAAASLTATEAPAV